MNGGAGVLDPQVLHLAQEAAVRVAHQDARQQASLAEDLEAVADAEHQAAALGVKRDRPHDRRSRRDRAAAEIVAIGEAPRQDHEVGALRQVGIGVPDDRRRVARDLFERAGGVLFAIGAGKEDDGGFHRRLRDLDRVILDDGVGEQPLAGLAQRLMGAVAVIAVESRCRTPCPGARLRRRRSRAT